MSKRKKERKREKKKKKSIKLKSVKENHHCPNTLELCDFSICISGSEKKTTVQEVAKLQIMGGKWKHPRKALLSP